MQIFAREFEEIIQINEEIAIKVMAIEPKRVYLAIYAPEEVICLKN